MGKHRLFVDMDGTLARFHDQVNYIERMFEKDFFRNLSAFENMVAGIRQFIQLYPDVDVYILSAKVIGEPPYCEQEKHAWLDRHLPEIPAERRIFTEMGRPKAEYIPDGLSKNDFLLDDYNKGLNQWLFDGGSAIKCHNNINQRGLGAHGGQRGNLWVGPMVHVDDQPALIAAELASHIGLEYDLQRVMAAYPGISLGSGKEISRLVSSNHPEPLVLRNQTGSQTVSSNPLNGIRQLSGRPEFKEVRLGPLNEPFYLPAFRLRDICSNYYHDPGYEVFLETSYHQLSDDVQIALEDATLPIVGQIEYLSTDGRVGDLCIFRSVEKMKEEIAESQDCGRPISFTWNVSLPPKPMCQLDYFELSEKLFLEYHQDEELCCYLAHALLKAPTERSREETQALVHFWQASSPPIREPLHEFLGISQEQLKVSYEVLDSCGLDGLIRSAENRHLSSTPSGRNGDEGR